MKSFKGYINEEWDFPVISLSPDLKHETFASKNLFNSDVRAQINVELLRGTAYLYVNPHSALNRVSEILARYGVIVPKAYWPDIEGGSLIWKIEPNGSLSGYAPTPGSEAAEHTEEALYLYFEYQLNEIGRYVVYSEVVTNENLDELLKEDLDEGALEPEIDPEHEKKIAAARKIVHSPISPITDHPRIRRPSDRPGYHDAKRFLDQHKQGSTKIV